MNYQHALIFYHTITPLHVGCGQAIGVVDLPVIRERSTGYPFIPGSGIRGSLRDEYECKHGKKNDLLKFFGPETKDIKDENQRHAGCVAIHDARILFYPVRCDREIFVWVTCPSVLDRYLNLNTALANKFPGLNMTGLTITNEPAFIGPANLGSSLHLEEFRFQRDESVSCMVGAGNLATFAGLVGAELNIENELKIRTVLIHDRCFYHFVNYATMLDQHNTLTSSKTVKEGALFSIESLPSETIFYGFIGATKSRRPGQDGTPPEHPDNQSHAWNELENFRGKLFDGENMLLHLGAKESSGMGLTRLLWIKRKENDHVQHKKNRAG